MTLDILLVHRSAKAISLRDLRKFEGLLNAHRPDIVACSEYSVNASDVIACADQLYLMTQHYGCSLIFAADDRAEVPVDLTSLRETFEQQRTHAREPTFAFAPEAAGYAGLPSFSVTVPRSSSFDALIGTRYHQAPDGSFFEFGDHRPWRTTVAELERAGISFERDFDKDSADSVGFYFDRNGEVYAFPKFSPRAPVHRFPKHDTRGKLHPYAVSICGELSDVTAEDLEGVEVLLNPSRENDDLHLRARTALLAGQSFEDATQYFGTVDADMAKRVRGVSSYLGDRHDDIRRAGVLVVRADSTPDGSGVLCLPEEKRVAAYNVSRNWSRLNIDDV